MTNLAGIEACQVSSGHFIQLDRNMSQTVFKLESLLETHEQPFIVIGADLKVVAVNRAWEMVYSSIKDHPVGRPCCQGAPTCRHGRLFQTLEPYAGIFSAFDESTLLVNAKGYPLLDADGRLYLGESMTPLTKTDNEIQQQSMIGKSTSFVMLKTKLQQAALIPAPVLLTGETGTGKELAAEYLHRHSHVSKGSFVIVDCTVFGEELFESELFGHEKGAFTGATSSKKGLFESADNGTLFLDEIGELPLAQQAKLLRAMESGQFRRVGGTTTLKASVRVICATHRHLAEMVKQGRFREDLFYRLSVFPIEIPPLRVRKQDIPLLVDYFRQQLGDIRGCQFSMTDQALQKLMRHDWPGNIRELKNCLQLAVGLCQQNVVQEEDIHFMQVPSVIYVGEEDSRASRLANETISSGMTALEEYEASFIANLIEKYQGNRKLVAAEMNISERTLYRKLNRLNLT